MMLWKKEGRPIPFAMSCTDEPSLNWPLFLHPKSLRLVLGLSPVVSQHSCSKCKSDKLQVLPQLHQAAGLDAWACNVSSAKPLVGTFSGHMYANCLNLSALGRQFLGTPPSTAQHTQNRNYGVQVYSTKP